MPPWQYSTTINNQQYSATTMASDAIRRRTKQQSLPMIHFYEQFIKNASARKAASATAAKTNNSIGTTSPTAQLSLDSHYQRYRDRSMSSDTTARIGMYSPDTLTTRSTIAVGEKLDEDWVGESEEEKEEKRGEKLGKQAEKIFDRVLPRGDHPIVIMFARRNWGGCRLTLQIGRRRSLEKCPEEQ